MIVKFFLQSFVNFIVVEGIKERVNDWNCNSLEVDFLINPGYPCLADPS